jgi:PAS domain S-box-containing protein
MTDNISANKEELHRLEQEISLLKDENTRLRSLFNKGETSVNTKDQYNPDYSNKRFRLMLERVSEIAVQAYRTDGTIIFWNKASEKLYGFSEQEVLGKNLLDFIIPQQLKEIVKQHLHEIESRGVAHEAEELVLKHRDGSDVHVFTNHTILANEKGERELFSIDIDLGKRVESERVILKQSEENKLLANLSLKLDKCNSKKEVFRLLTDSLQKVLPAAIISVSRFLEDGIHAEVFDFKGIDDLLLSRAMKVMRVNLRERKFKRAGNDLFEPLRLRELENGFVTLLNIVFHPVISHKVQKLTGIKKTFFLNIAVRDKAFGNVALMFRNDNDLPNVNLVESIVFQCASTMLQIDTLESLKGSEQKFRLIFENAPLGIVYFDEEGVITDCNDQFVRIMGSSKAALVGIDMTMLPNKIVAEHVSLVLKGKTITYEGLYTSVTANKTTPIRVMFAPVVNKNKLTEGGIGVVEDRTAHAKQQELENQVVLANESVKFKQNFLANMSHEIRTPLTGIMGMTDILISQTEVSPIQMEYLQILRSSGENLKEIINQVLDFSKIEAGKIKLRKHNFNLHSLLVNTHKFFKSICQKDVNFNVIISEDVPVYIKADENRILQIVNNLISNAVKFTNSGKIEVSASIAAHSENNEELLVRIQVKDSGIGIPKEKLKKLFVPFSQIEEKDTRYYEGTGLGLSICKELVNLQGGEIGVESQHLKGSTFWFTFKASLSGHQTRNSHENTIVTLSGNKKLNILFAEDKIVNQKVVSLLLTSMGHKVTIAENGKHAIELFSPGKFDLILMDIQMPVIDGITATRELKSMYENLPPVVGLSANAFEGDREKYIGIGMDDYLTKPVKSNDFTELLHRIFPQKYFTHGSGMSHSLTEGHQKAEQGKTSLFRPNRHLDDDLNRLNSDENIPE